jgi:hypothetical protein
MDQATRDRLLQFLGRPGPRIEIQPQQQMPFQRPGSLSEALDQFEQRESTVRAIGTKVIAGDLRNPEVFILTRQNGQFDSFFELPDENLGEKPCQMAKKCTAYEIPGRTTIAGIGPLKEFRLPEWSADTAARLLADGPMPCLACILQSQSTHIFEYMRTRADPPELLQFVQVRVGPGEFCADECHTIEAWGRFTGCLYPTPKWAIDKFVWAERDRPDGRGKRAYVKTLFRVGPLTVVGGPPSRVEHRERPAPQWEPTLETF